MEVKIFILIISINKFDIINLNFKVGGIKMAVKIENEKLFVTINEHGAELASLINKSNGMNYLWSGDSKYWEESLGTISN